MCNKGYCFINDTDIENYLGKTNGHHSGITKDEIIIPLIVVNSNQSKKN